MPSNVEIKARVADLGTVRDAARRLATAPVRVLEQEDVFFTSRAGRLKLRTLGDGTGELIHYDRPDTADPKQSDYEVYEAASPGRLRRVLAGALGETVTVRKRRELYLAGQTRIHLDEVEGLGSFVELEVVLQPEQTAAEGREVADRLMRELGIDEADLVPGSYADL